MNVVVLILLGAVSVLNVTSRPSVAAYRAVDVVQLIGGGMCFGEAVFALMSYLRARR
jgi:hypothetical protein